MRLISRSFAPVVLTLALSLPLAAQDAAPVGGPVTAVTTFQSDNQRTGFSAANITLPLSLVWRYSTEEAPRTYEVQPLVLGAPGQQRVYFSAGKALYCLDSQTGTLIYRSNILTSRVVVPLVLLPSENGDLIICATQGGRVVALRTSDGGSVWNTDVRSTISDSPPVVTQIKGETRILVAVSAGRIVALKTNGQIDPDWELKLGNGGVSPNSSITLSPSGEMLYIVGSDSRLYGFDAQKPAPAFAVRLAAQTSVTPVVAGEQVIVSNSRAVTGFRASTGGQLWVMNPRSDVLSSPVVRTGAKGTVIYFGTRNGIFYAVNTRDGKIEWKIDLQIAISGTPLALPNAIIVGTTNGFLVALNPEDGAVVWQYRLRTERAEEAAATAVATTNDAEGGEATPDNPVEAGPITRVWGVSGSPAAIDGRLFVFANNAAMYALTSQPFDAEPPRVLEPSLAVPDDQNKIAALLLAPDAPPIVPGRGPIYFAVELEDTGSGIDPATITMTLDGAVVDRKAITFTAPTGVITAVLLDTAKGAPNFDDGLKNLTLTVKDFAGNTLNYTGSFLIDNTTPPPASQIIEPTTPADGGADVGGEF